MGSITVSGFLATTEPLLVYGGVQLSPSAIQHIADATRAGLIPLVVQHDDRRKLNSHIHTVELRRTDSGSLGVWVELELDEQDWDSAKGTTGFSIAVVADCTFPNPLDLKPTLMLGVDAGHFDEADYLTAVALLRPHFAVGGGRLYQFSEIVPAKVLIEFLMAGFQAIPPNLISSVLYDVLKSHFLRPKHAERTVLYSAA